MGSSRISCSTMCARAKLCAEDRMNIWSADICLAGAAGSSVGRQQPQKKRVSHGVPTATSSSCLPLPSTPFLNTPVLGSPLLRYRASNASFRALGLDLQSHSSPEIQGAVSAECWLERRVLVHVQGRHAHGTSCVRLLLLQESLPGKVEEPLSG
jgi:hypothetical protein